MRTKKILNKIEKPKKKKYIGYWVIFILLISILFLSLITNNSLNNKEQKKLKKSLDTGVNQNVFVEEGNQYSNNSSALPGNLDDAVDSFTKVITKLMFVAIGIIIVAHTIKLWRDYKNGY